MHETKRSRLNRLMIRMAVSVVIPTMLAMSCLVIRTVRRMPFGSLIPLRVARSRAVTRVVDRQDRAPGLGSFLGFIQPVSPGI